MCVGEGRGGGGCCHRCIGSTKYPVELNVQGDLSDIKNNSTHFFKRQPLVAIPDSHQEGKYVTCKIGSTIQCSENQRAST